MTENDREEARSGAQTPSSLRHDLDSGKGRDKVPYPDPAAAPLGTDDEAAGTPVSDEQVQMARRHEIRGDGDSDTSAPAVLHGRKSRAFDSDATLQPHAQGSARQAGEGQGTPTMIYIAVALAIGLIVLLVLLLR